jgi:hypothetical protein
VTLPLLYNEDSNAHVTASGVLAPGARSENRRSHRNLTTLGNAIQFLAPRAHERAGARGLTLRENVFRAKLKTQQARPPDRAVTRPWYPS